MSTLKISLRVSAQLWMNPERNKELLVLLVAHPEIVEVAFFTQWTHPVLPLGVIAERARILKAVIPAYRAIGLRAGINHLSTVGHCDEDLDNALQEPCQHMVDSTGKVSGGVVCLSDERVQEYIRQSYVLLTQAEPDFIWIDDDLRLEGHMPLGLSLIHI